MNTVTEILGDIDEAKKMAKLEFIGVLADPLMRRILAKLACCSKGLETTMDLDDVSTQHLKSDKPSIITRLHKLANYGLVTVEKVHVGSRYHKRYIINDTGKEWVQKYMKRELKLFSE